MPSPSNRRRRLFHEKRFRLSMISAQTLRVCREGKPLHTFPDHALRRSRSHHLRQELLALLLRTRTLHGRRKALEDAILEGGDDGVVHIALAADRGRIG